MSNNESTTVNAMVDQVINQPEEQVDNNKNNIHEEEIELEEEMIQQHVDETSEQHYHEKKEEIRDDDETHQHDEDVVTTTPEEELGVVRQIAEPTADNIRVSIEKSDISSSVVGAGDPKPIKFVIPLVAAILNFVYAVIFLILSFVEIKLTIDFVQDYNNKYDKNEDFYEDNGYLEDDQVSLFSGISVFCLVIAALLSLFGAVCGILSTVMIWRREFFFDLLKTHKNYVSTILVLACLWLLASIVSLVPFSGIYVVLDLAVQFGTGIAFDWWAIIVVLVGTLFVGFAGLLLKRIWEYRSVYVKFGTL